MIFSFFFYKKQTASTWSCQNLLPPTPTLSRHSVMAFCLREYEIWKKKLVINCGFFNQVFVSSFLRKLLNKTAVDDKGHIEESTVVRPTGDPHSQKAQFGLNQNR